MSDQGEKTCPLCAEEMDLTDQQLKPCKCGYEICVWCWHHIMDMAEKDETEGRCPACRTPYNKEKIVGMAASCEKIVADTSTEKRFTSRKGKSKTADSRKQLSSVRVIQRNLVYIVGLPLNLADEDLLQRKEYFAQYGEVLKVSISRTAAGSIQQFANNTCSVYITYSKEEEAVRCIQSVHGFVLDDRPLRACFGTTKYCHAWLRNTPCTNTECLYLHEIGSQEDSFTKDETVSAFTRSRVQQITGATNSMQRRSGNVLPPPAEEYCNNSSDCAGIPISRTTRNNTATSVRCSPPNSSSGRSAGLPAGALWGTRASNSHWPPANVPGSNGPLNQKAATCSPATLYTAVASTSQVLLQPADAGKKILHSKEIDSIQEKQKMETFEPVKQQHEGADPQTYMSENLRVPVLLASSMNSQLHNASSLKEKNKHVLTPTSTMNAFDRSVMSNGPVFSKDSNDATDVKIHNACYDMSSLSIDRHEKSQCSYIEQSREPLPSQMVGESVSSADEICISREKSDVRMDTQTQGMQATPEMEDDLLSFDEQRHRDPEVIIEKSYSPNLSLSLHSLAQPRGHSPQLTNGVGPAKANMQVVDRRRDAIVQPSSIGSLPNGYSENVFSCVADLGTMKESYYNRMRGERLEGEASSVDRSMTVDTGENNIISNILSMDFDPWNESLTSPQNLAKLLGETDNHQGSLGVSTSRKANNSNQSRFSFAREEHANPSTDFQHSLSYIEDSFNYRPHGHGLSNSRSYQLDSFGNQNGFSEANNEESNGFTNNYSHLSSNKLSVSRSQMSAPPGFSAQNRPPPPGFTSHERKEHNFDSLYGSQLLDTSLLCNQYQAPPVENVSNGDIDFMDPAILAVGKGRILNGFNLSSLEMSSSFPPQSNTSENDARLQLLMQRSPSVHENQRFADIGGNFSPFNDTYREQTLSSNISPYHQLSFPQHRNSNMSNGHWDGWSGVQRGNDLGGADFHRAERLGLNKFLTGYDDSKFRMPNSGDYYNRTFGI